jgi:hypothetical protein
VQEFSLPNYVKLNFAKSALQEASSAAHLNTLFGYLDALSLCTNAKQRLRAAAVHFAKEAEAAANRKIAEVDGRILAWKNADMSGGWLAVAWLGVIMFFILGCQQCGRVSVANAQQRQLRRQTATRLLAELRSKGYDPDKLTIQQADAILGGDQFQRLPPANSGDSPFGTWFLWTVIGSALSITIAVAGSRHRKTMAIAPLEYEKVRLQQIGSEIQRGLTDLGGTVP